MTNKSIFIYGVPGSGKTTLSEALAENLYLTNLELDSIRIEAQKEATKESNPFLFEYTTTAWRYFSERLTPESAIKGLHAIRSALSTAVTKTLNAHREPILAEAAFIDPNTLTTFGECILITTPDEKRHYNQFFVHRKKGTEADEQFHASRYLNDFLLNEAKQLNISIVENHNNIGELTQKVIQLLETK